MLHPSYSELMAVVNSEVEEGEQPLVQSRYSIVKATAARAKEIIDARAVEDKLAKAKKEAASAPSAKSSDVEEIKPSIEDERKMEIGTPLITCDREMKPLSIAVQELYKGKVKIVGNSEN